MNEVLRALELDGLIVRSPAANHGRVVEVTLSERGQEVLAACDRAVTHMENAMLADLDDAGREQLLERARRLRLPARRRLRPALTRPQVGEYSKPVADRCFRVRVDSIRCPDTFRQATDEERGVVQVAQEIRGGGSSVTAEPALRVQDLRVSYAGAVQALRGVSLSVPEGAVVAVLGNNGAGKSTLLRAALRHARRPERGDHVGHDRVPGPRVAA